MLKSSFIDKNRRFSQILLSIICLKFHVYLFDCLETDSYNIKKIEKYSLATKSLEILADMFNDRREFCACFTGGNFTF